MQDFQNAVDSLFCPSDAMFIPGTGYGRLETGNCKEVKSNLGTRKPEPKNRDDPRDMTKQ